MTNNTNAIQTLTATVHSQAELIRQLKKAVILLERKIKQLDVKTSRVSDVARRSTLDISTLTRMLHGRNQ